MLRNSRSSHARRSAIRELLRARRRGTDSTHHVGLECVLAMKLEQVRRAIRHMLQGFGYEGDVAFENTSGTTTRSTYNIRIWRINILRCVNEWQAFRQV